MNQFPAVMVGGPPNSGKSVLIYNLTQQLRTRKIAHYVIRACPDGQGDYSNEADQDLVRLIRQKGAFTPTFVQRVSNALANRIFPLMVDVGGKPTPEQEVIFSHCTHAILLARTPEELIEWRTRAQEHGLLVIAELLSDLEGQDVIEGTLPLIRGVVSGLARGKRVDGPVLAALCDRLASLFHYSQAELREVHYRTAPVEMVIDFERMESILGFAVLSQRWEPNHLPILLERLPTATPLALYGRVAGWVYAAAALNVQPADIYHFDAQLGWVTPVSVQIQPDAPSPLLTWEVRPRATHTWLEIARRQEYYLSYEEIDLLAAPAIPTHCGLVLSGAMPNWLLLGLALRYQAHVPWIATFYPQLKQAVVVTSNLANYELGQLIAA